MRQKEGGRQLWNTPEDVSEASRTSKKKSGGGKCCNYLRSSSQPSSQPASLDFSMTSRTTRICVTLGGKKRNQTSNSDEASRTSGTSSSNQARVISRDQAEPCKVILLIIQPSRLAQIQVTMKPMYVCVSSPFDKCNPTYMCPVRWRISGTSSSI